MRDIFTLYAIPYAGGHSLVYRNLKEKLHPSIKLSTLEPPGRGKRASEALIKDMELIAFDLLDQIRGELEDSNYAIFGHSMGSLLAYIMCRKICEEGLPLPRHIFCSGHGAPSVKKIDPATELAKHTLSTEEFWEYIESLGALPPELKEHKELMNYFEPILRADIQALECYEYKSGSLKLDIPISVFYGVDDNETPLGSLIPWQNETRKTVLFYPFPGGHFGLFDRLPEFSQILKQNLFEKPENHE